MRAAAPVASGLVMRAAPVAFGLAIAGVAACAMKSPYSGAPERLEKPRATKMPPEDPVSVAPFDDPRPRIEALSTEIRRWRVDAALADEPSADTVMAMSAVSADDAAAACTAPPATGTCREVCDLGDSICDNAVEICRLADQLAGDAWAKGKCDSAKASCREADERCCTCRQPGAMP